VAATRPSPSQQRPAQSLGRLRLQEPACFEQAVLDLRIATGYGRAEGKATRTQLSSDGGLDGILISFIRCSFV
jgi:restriction endonuclease Mrr